MSIEYRNGCTIIDLWYPPRPGKGVANEDDRNIETPHTIRIQLMDVRAADDILVTYDFERDGYVIRMATIHKWAGDDEVRDEGLVEVAFVPSWVNKKEGPTV